MREKKMVGRAFVHITWVATQCPRWPKLGTLSYYCHHMPRCRHGQLQFVCCVCLGQSSEKFLFLHCMTQGFSPFKLGTSICVLIVV